MVERAAPAAPTSRCCPARASASVDDLFADAHGGRGRRSCRSGSGEIYLELHRGTLTTQGRTKHLHRQAERALITAETLASLARLLGERAPASLEPLWRVLLRNEFHDILPGSSIREVYEDAEARARRRHRRRRRGAATGAARRDRAAARAGGDGAGVLVVNPDLSPRPLRLSHDPLPAGRRRGGGLEAPA